MRLEAVELHRLEMPLVRPFRSAHGERTSRDVLVVRVVCDEGEGWAECVAEPDPSYSPEYTAGAQAVLEDHLIPRLFGISEPFEASSVRGLLSPVVGHPMAKAAIEVALWDAQLRSQGQRLADALGGIRPLVPAGVVVGIGADAATMVAEVADRVEEGYRRVKLKIAPGADVERVRAVREAFPDLALQVDGNGAYSVADALLLSKLDEFELQYLEQPLAPDDWLASARLASQLRTPICLDEPLVSAVSVGQCLDLGACSVVNLKVGRVGGLQEAMDVYRLCIERRAGLWVGGMLETGLGRAVNVALASLAGFTMPGDLSASSRYWHEDLTEPFELKDGCLAVPTDTGLGVAPRPDMLRKNRRSVKLMKREEIRAKP